MPELISILLFIGLTSLFGLICAQGWVIIRHQTTPPPDPEALVAVSILKPLKGVDDDLERNLRAIAELKHPHFEILFGAEDPLDPALRVARRIRDEFPEVNITVLAGGAADGLNPKVRVLRNLQDHAQHSWLLVSDSNVRPDVDYLSNMQFTQALKNAQLVHSPLSGVHGRGWGGLLEELQLNSWIAVAIALGEAVGRPCVIGKSMLMQRQALATIGGFESVKDILAEDYTLGEKFQQHGYQVSLCKAALKVVVLAPKLSGFFNRHVRWGQMRRHISPGVFFIELLSNPTPLLLTVFALGPSDARWLAAVALSAKWLSDGCVYQYFAQTPRWQVILVAPLRDILMPIIWLQAAFYPYIHWRGSRLKVKTGSRLVAVTPPETLARDMSAQARSY